MKKILVLVLALLAFSPLFATHSRWELITCNVLVDVQLALGRDSAYEFRDWSVHVDASYPFIIRDVDTGDCHEIDAGFAFDVENKAGEDTGMDFALEAGYDPLESDPSIGRLAGAVGLGVSVEDGGLCLSKIGLDLGMDVYTNVLFANSSIGCDFLSGEFSFGIESKQTLSDHYAIKEELNGKVRFSAEDVLLDNLSATAVFQISHSTYSADVYVSGIHHEGIAFGAAANVRIGSETRDRVSGAFEFMAHPAGGQDVTFESASLSISGGTPVLSGGLDLSYEDGILEARLGYLYKIGELRSIQMKVVADMAFDDGFRYKAMADLSGIFYAFSTRYANMCNTFSVSWAFANTLDSDLFVLDYDFLFDRVARID